jgi:hypothetical protein
MIHSHLIYKERGGGTREWRESGGRALRNAYMTNSLGNSSLFPNAHSELSSNSNLRICSFSTSISAFSLSKGCRLPQPCIPISLPCSRTLRSFMSICRSVFGGGSWLIRTEGSRGNTQPGASCGSAAGAGGGGTEGGRVGSWDGEEREEVIVVARGAEAGLGLGEEEPAAAGACAYRRGRTAEIPAGGGVDVDEGAVPSARGTAV